MPSRKPGLETRQWVSMSAFSAVRILPQMSAHDILRNSAHSIVEKCILVCIWFSKCGSVILWSEFAFLFPLTQDPSFSNRKAGVPTYPGKLVPGLYIYIIYILYYDFSPAASHKPMTPEKAQQALHRSSQWQGSRYHCGCHQPGGEHPFGFPRLLRAKGLHELSRGGSHDAYVLGVGYPMVGLENHRKTIGKCWFNGIWWDIMGYDGIWHVTWLYELRFKAKDTYSNLTSAILEPGYTHPRRPGTQVAHFIRVAPANTHIAAVLHW
jgi:hypothetical protein